MIYMGVDGGNFATKLVSDRGHVKFRSNIIPYRPLDLGDGGANDNMIVEHNEKVYWVGTVAANENLTDNSTMGGDSKNHDEAALRILIAVHKHVQDGEQARIFVGQPIKQFNGTEIEGIKNRLSGTHELSVNGVGKRFELFVRVVPECGGAHFSKPLTIGESRGIDLGSGTGNFVFLENNVYVNAKSGTVVYKDEEMSVDEMTQAVIRKTSRKWKKRGPVWLVGGNGEAALPFIQAYYPDAYLLKPSYIRCGVSLEIGAEFANAVGFYKMAKEWSRW